MTETGFIVGTEPAMYRLVIITSNTLIDAWYTVADEFRDRVGDPTAITTAKPGPLLRRVTLYPPQFIIKEKKIKMYQPY